MVDTTLDYDHVKLLYCKNNWSLRQIAILYNTNHHKIRRILKKYGIKIVKQPRQPFTQEHKKNISLARKGHESWIKNTKASIFNRYKNIAGHLRFNINYDWFLQFDDIDKLIFLNRCIRSNRFIQRSDEWYTEYILKFYHDETFNMLYKKWLLNNKNKYMRPTIDHIIPKSKGGSDDISNLTFLSWFENRAKDNMSLSEWNSIKQNIKEYLI